MLSKKKAEKGAKLGFGAVGYFLLIRAQHGDEGGWRVFEGKHALKVYSRGHTKKKYTRITCNNRNIQITLSPFSPGSPGFPGTPWKKHSPTE